MHSKQKGMIGETKVAAYLMERGYRVFTEMGDLSRIDLIAEKDQKLIRFQVKAYTTYRGKVEVKNSKSGPNYSFDYDGNDVDVFAVYVNDKDTIFFVNAKQLCEQKSGMCFRETLPDNGQKKNVRLFDDYTLDKAMGP